MKFVKKCSVNFCETPVEVSEKLREVVVHNKLFIWQFTSCCTRIYNPLNFLGNFMSSESLQILIAPFTGRFEEVKHLQI